MPANTGNDPGSITRRVTDDGLSGVSRDGTRPPVLRTGPFTRSLTSPHSMSLEPSPQLATPLTIERYTGNMHGFQAWGARKNPWGTMLKGLCKTLPGLENFHMVGQWAGATIGVSTAAIMARALVQTLCKQEKREFGTSVPG